MWLNDFEFDVIWTAFQLFLKLRSHVTVLWRFCKISTISEFSFFGYRPQNENLEFTENLYFFVCKVRMSLNLFFDHYFNFLSAKTKIKKKELNLINLDGLEALKRETPGTWLRIWVNQFEADVIWRASLLFLKLHSHNSVLWHFCSISVTSEFLYLSIRIKLKN